MVLNYRPAFGRGPMLPAAPLLDIARARAVASFNELDGYDLSLLMARDLGVTTRTVQRWMQPDAHIEFDVADKCATALGLHIDIIWPWGEA